jgi:hypothetical protein
MVPEIYITRGMTTDPERLKELQVWLLPKYKHKVSSLLGQCIHYWRFIAGFADNAKLLIQLRKEKQTSQWYPQAVVNSTCSRLFEDR